MRPLPEHTLPYYLYYINLVKEDCVNEALKNNLEKSIDFLNRIPAEKENFSYLPGKWTTKQLLYHLIDTERILSYRALRFARGDAQLLPSFDEDVYAQEAPSKERDLKSLIKEFECVRTGSIFLFESLSEKHLLRMGETSSGKMNVLSIGYMICGHCVHHLNILKERYLNT